MSINKNVFIHEDDRAALEALQSIPGFTPAFRAFMKFFNENLTYIQNMSTFVKIDENQLPEYKEMLIPICEKLGIEVPDLFMKLDVVPNAYTAGENKPFIVLTSGLIDTMPKYLIPTVLAHECGHIACHHVLYRTMGQFILNGSLAALQGLGLLLSLPLRTAFAYWMRCSEFSADRAAILCDESADKVKEMCLRFAGFPKNELDRMNLEAFMEQARNYKKEIEENKDKQFLEFLMFSGNSHPINAIRAYEADEWTKSDDFLKSKAYFETVRNNERPKQVPLDFTDAYLIGKDLDTVNKLFVEAGFNNIVHKRIAKRNNGVSLNGVSAVMIGDKENFTEGEWFNVNDEVTLTYYRPYTETELRSMHPGEIRFPKDLKSYIGRNYKDVELELFEAGFANSQTIRFGDLFNEKDRRRDQVCDITVNGRNDIRKDEWVPLMAKIEITYHDVIGKDQ